MSDTFDLLVLAVSRVKGGVGLAGMTTEPHPITGRVWVDIVRPDGPLQRNDLLVNDGSLVRPGDVLHCEGLQHHPEPPFVERWIYTPDSTITFARHITPERYARFMPEHLDQAPEEVFKTYDRSLALIKVSDVNALFELDARRYKTYMLFSVEHLGSYEIPVVDLAWRALGRQWLAEQESNELALDAEEVGTRFGALFVVVGLYKPGWLIARGVHAVPALDAPIDLEKM